jgi:hypothetical protein
MPRPQFTLRALLVAMLVVGAFFGGMTLQRRIDEPLMVHFPDASKFHRIVDPITGR